jgi:hypothetical protein
VVRPRITTAYLWKLSKTRVVLVDRARPLGVDGAQPPVLTGGWVAQPQGNPKGHDDFVMTQPQLPVTIPMIPDERPSFLRRCSRDH